MNKLLNAIAIFLLLISLTSCMSRKERARLHISRLEKGNFAKVLIDTASALETIAAYQKYIERYRYDSMSPEYLIRAGSLYMNLGQPKLAVYYCRRSITWYPKSPQAPYAWFLLAFITENYLKEYMQAVYLYRKILHMYPSDQLADDVESSLEYAGKSAHEIFDDMRTKRLIDTVYHFKTYRGKGPIIMREVHK